MCLTYGQWLQMKATTRAGLPAASRVDQSFPETASGSSNAGAVLPSGNMVEVTATMPPRL
jgi:hypothetical protein